MSVSAASPMPNSEAAVVAALVSCLAFAVGSRKQVLAGLSCWIESINAFVAYLNFAFHLKIFSFIILK